MKKLIPYDSLNIRAEVLLSEWLSWTEDIDLDDLAIDAGGGFNRSLRRDIDDVAEVENEYGLVKQKIKLTRKGFFDHLPSGLFYERSQQEERSIDNPESAGIKEIKERKQIEKECRRFFSPFDQLFNRYRMFFEQEERKLFNGFPEGYHQTLCEVVFGHFNGQLSAYQQAILISILPMAHQGVGDVDFTVWVFKAITGLDISIDVHKRKQVFEYVGGRDGDCRLGDNLILGNNYHETVTLFSVSATSIPEALALQYVPNGKGRSVLNLLSEYFIPTGTYVDFNYKFETAELFLETADQVDQRSGNNRLGYTIQI